MKNRALFIYVLLILTTAIGFYLAQGIELDANSDGYSLALQEDLEVYEDFQKNFPVSHKTETIIILENEKGWRTYEDFTLLSEASKFWENQTEVVKSLSITNLIYPRKGIFLIKKEPFLDLANEKVFKKRLSKLSLYEDIVEKFVSKNKKYALLHITVKDENGIRLKSKELFDKTDARNQGIKAHYLQYDLIQKDLKETMRTDAILLALISSGLILLSFYLLTKSLKGLLLIGLVIAFNLACTLLFMVGMNISFSINMIAVPCIVIVLSFTDVMHLIYHQQLLAKQTSDDKDLRMKIINRVKSPMLLSSLTNVVGFIVFLILSENEHMFNFSLVAIVGVAIAFLNSRFIVVHLLGKNQMFIRRFNYSKLNRIHESISNRILMNKKMVLASLILITTATVIGVAFMFKIDTSENDFKTKKIDQMESIQILRDEFFGVKKIEIAVRLKGDDFWTVDRLSTLEKVEEEVGRILETKTINTPTLIAKRYHRYITNGNPNAFTIQKTISTKTKADLIRYGSEFGGDGVLSKDKKTARIIFGTKDFGLEKSRMRYREVKDLLSKSSNDEMSFELTGKDYLSDEGTFSFTLKILFGLGIGILLSSILTFLFIKSIKESIGLIFVNLIPVLITLALMLAIGIAITPLTLFFLSILVGICVDDSIYIVAQNKEDSLKIHLFPIFVTSSVLAIGFVALGFSSFQWIKPFAWIFLVGIAIAYLMDIFILPLFFNRNVKFEEHG